MHVDTLSYADAVKIEPISGNAKLKSWMTKLIFLGVIVFCVGLFVADPKLFWGAYYTNAIYWLGLGFGGVVIACIFQIVGAVWCHPVRRIAEAHINWIPWALGLMLFSYMGRVALFPWATRLMPGKESWMMPDFVYGRYAVLLFLLYWLMRKFIRFSLRADVGHKRELSGPTSHWQANCFDCLVKDWQGSDKEIPALNAEMSWYGPLIIVAYAIIYSLFAFDMIMSLNAEWYATMFAGFVFVGNVYLGWAFLAMWSVGLKRTNLQFDKAIGHQQMHDIGKLMFGFGVVWAYLFFAHFLPIWYGNMPEETQWMILRTRENPWRILSWSAFGMCFIFPFIVGLSRDIKKSLSTLAAVAFIVAIGLWVERYILVMPEMSEDNIPLGLIELGLFLGFAGGYVLSILSYLEKYPPVTVSRIKLTEEAH